MSKPREKQTVDERIKSLGGYTEPELRELVREMRRHADTEFDDGKGKYAATVQRKWARELEGLIDDE